MLYILIVLIIVALLIFGLFFPFTTVWVHYKELSFDIRIKHLFFKKRFFFDLSKEKGDAPKNNKEKSSSDKGSGFDFKGKINQIKERIYNPETGFDLDEAKNVKDELFASYSDMINMVRVFLEKSRFKIHIPTLRIKMEYGTGNPANTGMIYGSVWGLIGILYPIAARYFHIAYPQTDITPDFYGKRFNIEVKSIIKVRPTHIINAAAVALRTPILTYFKNKIKKGRDK